jgi:hypothetical protein
MSGSEGTGDGAVIDTSGYPVIGSAHTLRSDGSRTAGYMSVMAGICPRVIGSDAENCQGLRPTP